MTTPGIEINTHSSIRINDGKTVVYFDPFEIAQEKHDAGIIYVTHDHYDHFSPEDIAKVANENTIFVCPEKMISKAQTIAGIVKKIVTVKPSTFSEESGLETEVIPSYNLLKPFHTKSAEWCGYVVHFGGKRIYVAGDTDATKEAKAVKCDIALVPIGGTYTMDAKKAAELVNTLNPEIAIPTHYGKIVGKKDDAEEFKKLVKPTIKVEVLIK
ncbi:MAG: MBL fold metallo-hydrolase [Lachnospiraceae bacterium]|nr:MBL fold metallo-hydrolase [Lachnospiraceae bacterium]